MLLTTKLNAKFCSCQQLFKRKTTLVVDSYIFYHFSLCGNNWFSWQQLWKSLLRGFIKGGAQHKLTGCEGDLAINLPGCFHLLFLLSFIRKSKNAQVKNLIDLLHKNLMKPLPATASWANFVLGMPSWNLHSELYCVQIRVSSSFFKNWIFSWNSWDARVKKGRK